MLVTIKVTNADSRRVIFELTSATGREIEFIPYDNSQKFDFQLNNYPLWELLEHLSQYGKLKIGGIDFDDLQKIRHMMVSGEKVSMCVHGATVKSVVSYLSFLSGFSISIASGDAELSFSSSLKEVTLDEIIAGISKQTGVKLVTIGTVSLHGTIKSTNSYYHPLLLPLMNLWIAFALGIRLWL